MKSMKLERKKEKLLKVLQTIPELEMSGVNKGIRVLLQKTLIPLIQSKIQNMTEDDLQNTINVAKKAIELLEDDEEKELENVCH